MQQSFIELARSVVFFSSNNCKPENNKLIKTSKKEFLVRIFTQHFALETGTENKFLTKRKLLIGLKT
jgi:hypothetical protein